MSSRIHRKKICLCCMIEVQSNLICGKCRVARYCNRECQKNHWPAHKHVCKDSNSNNGDSSFFYACYTLAWNGTMWVAVGSGTNTIAYSYNGIK